MSRFKVLVTDYAWNDLSIEQEVLGGIDAELFAAPSGDEATLVAAARDCDAIMNNWAKVTAAVLDAAAQCRIVARLGVGLDSIDVARATQRGIVVTKVPDYCHTEVAEHALALLMALARNVGWHHGESKQGRYDLKSGPALRRIEGQTLGIVGLGNIGRCLAEKAQGLGLRVLATSRTQSNPPPGVKFCTLDRLLAESDYVSLHLPLTSQTRHLIGAAELAHMKPTAYLINTARGGLVDHQALSASLAASRIAGAGLDVQEKEPPDLSAAPYNDPRVIVTPHIAFVSVESLEDLRRRASQQIVDCLSGRAPQNVVNPQVLAPDRMRSG